MSKKFFEEVTDREISDAVNWIEKNPFTGREVKPGRLDYAFEVFCDVQKLWCGIGVRGGMLTAFGEEKSFKSTFMGLMMTAFLSKDGIYQDMRCNIDSHKIGLWADTEIPQARLIPYQNSYLTAAGLSSPPSNYKLLQLKRFSSYGLKAATFITYLHDYRHDLGFVALDGFIDLISGMNDEIQAKDLMAEIDYCREEYGFLFGTLIHKNRNSNKTSGSAGSVLDKKSDMLIDLIKTDPKDPKSDAIVQVSRTGLIEVFEPKRINFVNNLPSFIY